MGKLKKAECYNILDNTFESWGIIPGFLCTSWHVYAITEMNNDIQDCEYVAKDTRFKSFKSRYDALEYAAKKIILDAARTAQK